MTRRSYHLGSLAAGVMSASIVSEAEVIVRPGLDLTAHQEKALVRVARDRAGTAENVAEVRAFRAYGPFWSRRPASANILFSPIDIDGHTFTVTQVDCVRKRPGWDCEPAEVLTFVHEGDYAKSFRVYSSVLSIEAALAVYRVANQDCSIAYQASFIFKPSLGYDAEDNLYSLYGTSGCTYTFSYSDGNAVRRDPFFYLE